MNETIIKTSLSARVLFFFKNNYKVLITISSVIAVLLLIFQYYSYSSSKNVLNKSILYNQIISDKTNDEFISNINKLSKDKSFYGVLSALEGIKYKLNQGDLESAYKDYLYLLENKKLNTLFKSIISVQASHNFLNTIDILELKKENNLFVSSDIYKKINILLSYADDSIESIKGIKFEISFLLLVIEQDYNGDKNLTDDTKKLYEEIQQNDKISSTIKERVKKIYDFQKYN